MSEVGKNFDQLAAYGLLRTLAEAPYDLSALGALYPERISQYVCRAGGFDLLYATQRVDDLVLDGLQALADEAKVVDSFRSMTEGAVMNRIEGHESENRQVLHTACRDIFSDSPANPDGSAQAREQLHRLKSFLAELDNGTVANHKGEAFTDMVHIGIGGSDLGPRAFHLALKAFAREDRFLHFISNVDPDDAAVVLAGLDLSRTLVNVVSKSGTTLETLTNEELVKKAFVAAGLEPAGHFIAVTGQGSPMDNPQKYLRSFYMYDYIGGRYSVTSMVGAVALSFALGYEHFEEVLRGANDMDRAVMERDIHKNPALLLALLGIWNHNFLGFETVAVLPYSQALQRFPAHLQQCDMESNGKSTTRNGERPAYQTGPIVWGEPGTNGQHAFYQLIHQGTTVVPVEFIGFRRSQYNEDLKVQETTSQQKLVANLLAQSIALASGQQDENPNRFFPGNRPSSILLADRLDPYTMGGLMALYEAKIVFQGFLWNINSFDQEGVQLGKKLASGLLDIMKKGASARATGDSVGKAMLSAAGLLD